MKRLVHVAALALACACAKGAPPGMVAIPSTTFELGCDPARDPSCADNEQPRRTVRVAAFFLDRDEVTQGAYARCVAAKACTSPSSGFEPEAHPSRPVVEVTWAQARAYCAWSKARLPTEAEWELAARGTDGRMFPWGDEKPDCRRAQLASCGPGPLDVGGREQGASPFGVRDLAGNVDEWVEDAYARYGEQPKSGERVARGGAYDAWHSRATARSALAPGYHDALLGLRCAASR